MKVPDVPEGDGTQQNNESDTLPPSQADVGKGPQKKSLAKRKDQRAPESLDSQTRPWARSAAPLNRRTLATQSPGDKKSVASAQLRRNVSSAGRLQGLCTNAPGRKESSKAEVYLPSGKKRPKSLEMNTYLKGEPPNSEAFPIQERTRNGSLVCMRATTMNGRAMGALEKDRGIPEHSEHPEVLDEETFRNLSSKTSLIGEERGTTSWTENGKRSPETTESSKGTAGSMLCDSCDPDVPLSLCEKPDQTPEDPASLGQAAYKGTLPQNSRKCDVGPEKCTFTHLAQQIALNFS